MLATHEIEVLSDCLPALALMSFQRQPGYQRFAERINGITTVSIRKFLEETAHVDVPEVIRRMIIEMTQEKESAITFEEAQTHLTRDNPFTDAVEELLNEFGVLGD